MTNPRTLKLGAPRPSCRHVCGFGCRRSWLRKRRMLYHRLRANKTRNSPPNRRTAGHVRQRTTSDGAGVACLQGPRAATSPHL